MASQALVVYAPPPVWKGAENLPGKSAAGDCAGTSTHPNSGGSRNETQGAGTTMAKMDSLPKTKTNSDTAPVPEPNVVASEPKCDTPETKAFILISKSITANSILTSAEPDDGARDFKTRSRFREDQITSGDEDITVVGGGRVSLKNRREVSPGRIGRSAVHRRSTGIDSDGDSFYQPSHRPRNRRPVYVEAPAPRPMYEYAPAPPPPLMRPTPLCQEPNKMLFLDDYPRERQHVLDIQISDPAEMGDAGGAERAEKLRINSLPVLKILEKLTTEFFGPPYVLLRPFRFLMQHRDHLGRYLAVLEKIHTDKKADDPDDAGKPRTATKESSGGGWSSDILPEVAIENITETEEGMQHLRCLLKFIDEECKSDFDLVRAIKNGSAQKIAFKDIDLLFQAGEEVYSQKGVDSPQVYRVLATTGGRPLRKTEAPIRNRKPIAKAAPIPSPPLPAPSHPPSHLVSVPIGGPQRRVSSFPRNRQPVPHAFPPPSPVNPPGSTPGSPLIYPISPNISPPPSPPLYYSHLHEPMYVSRYGCEPNHPWDYDNLRARKDGKGEPLYRRHDTASPFIIDCYSIDFDGLHMGGVQRQIEIRSYKGEKLVTSLPAFPLQFLPGLGATRAQLLDRGKSFLQMLGVSHKYYEGLSLAEPKEEIQSQVIVDPALGLQLNPEWVPKLGLDTATERDPREANESGPECSTLNQQGSFCRKHSDPGIELQTKQHLGIFTAQAKLLDEARESQKLGDSLIILLPGRIFGFILRSRKWAPLDVTLMKDVPDRKEGFNSLILPKGHRDLVEALVQTHSRGSRPTSGTIHDKGHEVDLVRGKGKGLIILLHGAPGVGKTSTAECVADFTGRPLFPITCGDIGAEAREVEENLEKHFYLAHKWGCVLLLDEADIFLQKRDKADLRRNSLVSVFLRVLEYYSGILFLTTNRVGMFDEAFKSRIHISLYYPPLDRKAYLAVWDMNLRRTQEGKENIQVDRDEILGYANRHYKELKWNGRQIRNAFQTAIALAEFDARKDAIKVDVGGAEDLVHPPAKLTRQKFAKVAKATKDFDEYLKEVYAGSNDADIAEREEVRKDTFLGYHARRRPTVNRYKKEEESESEEDTSTGSGEDEDDSDSEDQDESSENEKRRRKKSKGKKPKRRENDSDDSEEEEGEAKVRKKAGRKKSSRR